MANRERERPGQRHPVAHAPGLPGQCPTTNSCRFNSDHSTSSNPSARDFAAFRCAAPTVVVALHFGRVATRRRALVLVASGFHHAEQGHDGRGDRGQREGHAPVPGNAGAQDRCRKNGADDGNDFTGANLQRDSRENLGIAVK